MSSCGSKPGTLFQVRASSTGATRTHTQEVVDRLGTVDPSSLPNHNDQHTATLARLHRRPHLLGEVHNAD